MTTVLTVVGIVVVVIGIALLVRRVCGGMVGKMFDLFGW